MRQVAFFVLAGLIQAAVDTVLFGTLLAMGMPTARSNVVSRVCAALLGFALNRYGTFGHRADNWKRFGGSLWRFVVLFAFLTLASTGSILFLERQLGASFGEQLVYKIGVEALLAVLSFFASRHWVYRH